MPDPMPGLADYIARHSRELTHSLPRDEALRIIELVSMFEEFSRAAGVEPPTPPDPS
jgi:hypothetical protein